MNTDIILKQVNSCQVLSDWDSLEYLLDMASEYWEEHYTLEQIRQLLLTGALQFWHLRREERALPYLGAMTRIDVYGLKKVLNFVWLGGESFDEILSFLWVVELWAKKVGISEIEVTGRGAFERVLRGSGFERTHVVLRKRLSHLSEKEH